MVIGNGFVANAFSHFTNDDNCLVFASGVSNSTNKDESNFKREGLLLTETLKKNRNRTFIYFSSCSIYDALLKESPYVKHKLAMEQLIESSHDSYHIFRVSNLAGKTDNPNTILNFFFQHILSGDLFNVWGNAERNIIDVDDAVRVCSYIIQNRMFVNKTVNIANLYNYPVLFIINSIERMLLRQGEYNVYEMKSIPQIDTSAIQSIFTTLNILFEENYLKNILEKYYSTLIIPQQ